MLRKNLADEMASRGRQVNHHLPPVVPLAFAANPTTLLKVIHDHRDVSSAAKKLPAERVLAHRTQVQQSLKHGELPGGQATRFDLRLQARANRIRRSHEIDVGVQCAFNFGAASVMSWHPRLPVTCYSCDVGRSSCVGRPTFAIPASGSSIRFNSNDWMAAGSKGFSPRSRLLCGAKQDFADEALGCLRDDHLDGMSYIVWLQHLADIFIPVR